MPNTEDRRDPCERVKRAMQAVGSDLRESMKQILEALEQRNGAEAGEIPTRLEDVREKEDTLKELCLQILGEASGSTPELRWTGCAHNILTLMSKVSREIGILVQQIGRIHQGPELPIGEDLPDMARLAAWMLDQSIRTALDPDAESARRVMEEDSSLDQRKEDFARRAILLVNEYPESSQPVVPYVLVSRHLERIGDHASHIAEEVAYYLEDAAA